MSGKPDYGPGDLVVVVHTRAGYEHWKGTVLLCLDVFRDNVTLDWVAVIQGYTSPHRTGGFMAKCFKKLPPKPLEFFSGEIPVKLPEKENA